MREKHEAHDDYDALHDGVPEWLRVGLARWVSNVFRNAPYGTDIVAVLHNVEQLLRLSLDWSLGAESAVGTLTKEILSNGDRALDIIDCCLMLSQRWPSGIEARESLEVSLAIGGSAWQIGTAADGWRCLERRVDSTVETAAKAEIQEQGNASRHLQQAWHGIYGRSPNPSAAYREAVRAVEAAAKPVLLPKDPVATLGKMIRAVRDKPEKWVSEIGTVEVLADMMDQLWTSQLDRHGTDDESVPLTVSLTQAEAAVHLAVMLVHWFRSGFVRLAISTV